MGVEGKTMSVKQGKAGHLAEAQGVRRHRPGPLGIIVVDGRNRGTQLKPRMRAFIWGGKVTPPPTLPFGRWKSVA